MEKLGRECKKLMAEEIKKKLKESGEFFLISFNAMAVSEQEELKGRLHDIDASIFVVKNRIAKQAFEQLDLGALATLPQGLTAITLGIREAIDISKALVNFADKHNNFKLLGAYVDEQLLDVSSIRQLASVTSKEALLTQVVCGIKAPIQGLVNSLSATIKKFVVVLDRIREKQK